MQNYKALKVAGKTSLEKVKVIDRAKSDAVLEVKYKDGDDIPKGKEVGDVKIKSQPAMEERSHEELHLTSKNYDSQTGEELDSIVAICDIKLVERRIKECKSDIDKIKSAQADWEELEKDLKAL